MPYGYVAFAPVHVAPLHCPLLANIYLDPLDHPMAAKGWEMTRYADDFIIQCHTEAEALAAN